MNCPGFAEAVWFKLGSHGDVVRHGVIEFFGLGRRHVADGLEQAAMVEPVYPFQRGIFDGFKGSPWPASMDHLGLVEAVDGLGQSVVVAVADAADRGFDPGFGEALGILDRHILRPAVAMMNQAATVNRSTIV